MPSFSKISKQRLSTCVMPLQQTLNSVIEIFDMRVLEGRRTWDRQAELFHAKKTKLGPGQSKHNSPIDGDESWLSLAVDVAPYPIDWHDSKRFVYMAGLIIATGRSQGVDIRWGGNWDMDQVILDDQNFDDLPHFEIYAPMPNYPRMVKA